MATLNDCLLAIQEIVGRVEGVRAAPEYVTDKVPAGVWSMAFPLRGTYTQAPIGTLKGLHEIGLYVYAPRLDLSKTLRQVIPLGDKIAAALESNPDLDGTCSTFGEISYEFQMALNVGTAQAPAFAAGWTFTISGVKIEDITSIT